MLLVTWVAIFVCYLLTLVSGLLIPESLKTLFPKLQRKSPKQQLFIYLIPALIGGIGFSWLFEHRVSYLQRSNAMKAATREWELNNQIIQRAVDAVAHWKTDPKSPDQMFRYDLLESERITSLMTSYVLDGGNDKNLLQALEKYRVSLARVNRDIEACSPVVRPAFQSLYREFTYINEEFYGKERPDWPEDIRGIYQESFAELIESHDTVGELLKSK